MSVLRDTHVAYCDAECLESVIRSLTLHLMYFMSNELHSERVLTCKENC